jgi:hypothetical protein
MAMPFLSPFVLASLVSTTAAAIPPQNPPAAPAPESRPAVDSREPSETSGEVAKALARLAEKEMLQIRGTVSRDESEEDNPMAGARMILAGGEGGGAPFEGDFDLVASGHETTVLAERDGIGFGFHKSGDRTVTRETYADSKPDIVNFRREVLALTDRGNLIKRTAKAAWTRQNSEGEFHIYTANIDKKAIPAAKGPMPMEKIVRVEAKLTTNAAGDVVSLRFVVVKKDPFADMLKNTRIEQGKGDTATATIQVSPGQLMSDDTKENDAGQSTTYQFDVVQGAVSQRLAEFRKAMLALGEKK